MVALSDEKTIFDMYIEHNGSDEIIKSLELKYKVKRETILLHIRNYIKTRATKDEINLYNKVIHKIDRYKDYKKKDNNCISKSHYFKYYNILLLLSKKLDEYMLTGNYFVIVNYIEGIKDKGLLHKESRRRFYSYIRSIYSEDESKVIENKIEKIVEIYKLYSTIINSKKMDEKKQKIKIIEQRRIFKIYLLELAKMNLFESLENSNIKKSKEYLMKFDYNNFKNLILKEEELKKEIKEREIEKIKEINYLIAKGDFDIFDYYMNYGYNLWNVINKSRMYGLEKETTQLVKLYNKYIFQNIFVESTFLKLDYKFYKSGNEYKISNSEKELIIRFIKSNNLPKTHEIVRAIYFKYKNGKIDLSKEKILRKN